MEQGRAVDSGRGGGDKHKGECGGSGLCVGGQENCLCFLIVMYSTVVTVCFLQFAA